MFTYIFSPRRFHYLHGFSSLLKGACLSVCVFWVFGSVQLGEIVCRVFSYLYFQNAAAFLLFTSVLNTTFKKLEAILAPRSTCVEKLET